MGAIAPDINARVLTAREIARGATVSPTGDRCAKKSYRPQAIGAQKNRIARKR